jgi:hypothetical protein
MKELDQHNNQPASIWKDDNRILDITSAIKITDRGKLTDRGELIDRGDVGNQQPSAGHRLAETAAAQTAPISVAAKNGSDCHGVSVHLYRKFITKPCVSLTRH